MYGDGFMARIGINDEVELAEDVVDHGKFIGNEKQDVRRAERIGLLLAERPWLDMPYRFVAEVTDEAAAKAQGRRQRGGAGALQPFARVFERIRFVLFQAHVGAARIAQKSAQAPAARLDTLGTRKTDE